MSLFKPNCREVTRLLLERENRRLGPLEWILNTPSAHRVHHASNLQYLDGNYGGVLILFDRLFGTYIAERADVPCRFGLVRPMTGYNLLAIEFHQWQGLWRDLRTASSFAQACGYLLRPPGWRPSLLAGVSGCARGLAIAEVK
jgi:hypothetical protein